MPLPFILEAQVVGRLDQRRLRVQLQNTAESRSSEASQVKIVVAVRPFAAALDTSFALTATRRGEPRLRVDLNEWDSFSVEAALEPARRSVGGGEVVAVTAETMTRGRAATASQGGGRPRRRSGTRAEGADPIAGARARRRRPSAASRPDLVLLRRAVLGRRQRRDRIALCGGAADLAMRVVKKIDYARRLRPATVEPISRRLIRGAGACRHAGRCLRCRPASTSLATRRCSYQAVGARTDGGRGSGRPRASPSGASKRPDPAGSRRRGSRAGPLRRSPRSRDRRREIAGRIVERVQGASADGGIRRVADALALLGCSGLARSDRAALAVKEAAGGPLAAALIDAARRPNAPPALAAWVLRGLRPLSPLPTRGDVHARALVALIDAQLPSDRARRPTLSTRLASLPLRGARRAGFASDGVVSLRGTAARRRGLRLLRRQALAALDIPSRQGVHRAEPHRHVRPGARAARVAAVRASRVAELARPARTSTSTTARRRPETATHEMPTSCLDRRASHDARTSPRFREPGPQASGRRSASSRGDRRRVLDAERRQVGHSGKTVSPACTSRSAVILRRRCSTPPRGLRKRR